MNWSRDLEIGAPSRHLPVNSSSHSSPGFRLYSSVGSVRWQCGVGDGCVWLWVCVRVWETIIKKATEMENI